MIKVSKKDTSIYVHTTSTYVVLLSIYFTTDSADDVRKRNARIASLIYILQWVSYLAAVHFRVNIR